MPLYQPVSSATALPDGIVEYADLSTAAKAAAAAAAVAAGSGTYVPLAYTRNVWFTGDSLTAGAGTPGAISYDSAVFSNTRQGGLWFTAGSYVTHALMASQCRWTVAGVAATGGYTAAQILSTHVPAIVSAATPGDTVVVLAGTNGLVLADVQTIHTTLRAAGLRTVAVTLPPRVGVVSETAAFNAGLEKWCFARGIPLVDVYSTIVNTSTGVIAAAYDSGDGTHPNAAGAQLMGAAVATVVNGLFSTVVPLVGVNTTITGQLQRYPLATATVPGVDWTNLSALGTSTIGEVGDADFLGGNCYGFTRGDTDVNGRMGLYTLVAGHRFRVGFQFKATMGGSGAWIARLESNTTGAKLPWGLGHSTTMTTSHAISSFYSEFVCPTLPDYSYRMRVIVNGASSNARFGRVTIQDLTAMGAA